MRGPEHVRVAVDGINQLYIRPPGDPPERTHYPQETIAEILAPVPGYYDEPPASIEPRPLRRRQRARFQCIAHVQNGIDPGVARDVDAVPRPAFGQEIGRRSGRRRKVQVRDAAG